MRTSMFIIASDNDVIGGDNGGVPWHIDESSRFFMDMIRNSVIIVGHNTFNEITREVGRPLPNVLTIVLSGSPWPGLTVSGDRDVVMYQPTVQAALKLAKAFTWFIGKKELFIIGGAKTFTSMLPYVDRVYLTRVHVDVPGNVRMPLGWLDDFAYDQNYKEIGPVTRTAELHYSIKQFNRKRGT
jgi:dihydrofolate reductase